MAGPAAPADAVAVARQPAGSDSGGVAAGAWRPLFDGQTLAGWHAVPRLPTAQAPGTDEVIDPASAGYRAAAATSGRWWVEDGAIVGGQEVTGFGGYLVTDQTFGDFELRFEVRPDWPADTGVLLRATPRGTQGFQVLIDHRKSGSIGGFYGNGIGGFHLLAFNLDVVRDRSGRPKALQVETPATTLEPVTPVKRASLSHAVAPEDFLRTWRFGGWNEFQVRCEGTYPVLTTWLNGLKLYQVDTAAITGFPLYDRDQVLALLGRQGHIALEVHDNDPGMGEARWAPGAVVRWRNLVIREL
ncbi:MAG: DUF1080 domain-containing protein [Bifidobacteriaceae bacterium]|jgi:hypothetical protein|nr:DUF1080 domain-containing protein [Bifidobacteriaceae bacterium]